MDELNSITKLIDSFKLFPSVGSKSAERMAYALLDMDEECINRIISSIKDAKENIHQCQNCGILTDQILCPICDNSLRDHQVCLVIESPKDALSFEKTDSFRGIYHVLGGLISSLKGIKPSDLKINELIKRIEKENIKEIIIATNSTIEGETTALYLAKILEKFDVVVTRLAFGLPMNGKFDYADELTLSRSLEGRITLKK